MKALIGFFHAVGRKFAGLFRQRKKHQGLAVQEKTNDNDKESSSNGVSQTPATFECQRCRKMVSIEDIFKVERCGHQFCRQCIRRFLLDLSTLKCPLYNKEHENCTAEITFEEAAFVLRESELMALFHDENKLLPIAMGGDLSPSSVVVNEGAFFCEICYMATSFNKLFQLSAYCDHILCRFCASKYINDPASACQLRQLSCPILGCPAIVDLDNALPLLDPEFSTFECQICAEKTQYCDLFRFNRSCGHEMCRDCARRYLKSLIDDRKPLKCPIVECQADDFCVADAELVLDGEELDRLCEMLLQISTADYFHCPEPNCRGLAEVVPPRTDFVCPECNYKMCVQCRRGWHASVSCEQYAKWFEDKSKTDTEFVRYARLKHLQVCPKCRNAVERSEGCNHMKCRCGAEFCYQCGQNYHPYQNCCTQWVWNG